MKTILILLIAFFISPLMHAQSLGQELQKIRNAYFNAEQLSFDVEAYSYETKNDKTASLLAKGYVKKNKDMYYSNFQNYELMVKGEKALIVDAEAKSLTYYEYKLSKGKAPQQPQFLMDSLLAQGDSIVLHPVKNGVKQFTSYSKNGFIKQTELYVDTKTNMVSHILYYYVESTEDYEMQADRVEIFYKNVQTTGVDPSFFSFDKYFKNVKSSYVPTARYQGYKVKYVNAKS